jgi:hypothetical protein
MTQWPTPEWEHTKKKQPHAKQLEQGSSGLALRPNWTQGKQNEIKPVHIYH